MAKKLAFDRVLFTTVMLLVGFGLVMVYSASAAQVLGVGSESDSPAVNPFLVKQTVAALLGFLAMGVAMHLPYRRLTQPAVVYTLLGGILVLLVAVLFGPEINGTRRWFLFGGFSLQPSELAKLALVIFLAYQIERKDEEVNQARLLIPCSLVPALLAGLIVLQPDLGTAVLLVATTLLMLVLAGLRWRYLAAGAAALVPVLALLVVTEPYRLRRLLAFLYPERDPLGAGYQALQSLIAVGSGGLVGLGPGESVQKLHFLPHPHSDFVFAIVAEELGLLGALGVLGLFAVLLWRGVRAGLNAPDAFGRHLGWGLTGLVVIQGLINISVAVALLPTKGIPLPLISYGGSSLVVMMTACGVVLNVSQHG